MRNNGGINTNKIKSAEQEFNGLLSTRGIWSGNIGKYNQIFLPLIFVVISLMFTQLPYFLEKGQGFSYLMIGGFILIAIIGIWRFGCIHGDRAIVFLYPRLLELEHALDLQYFTSYLFRYLSKDAKEDLLKKLGDDFSLHIEEKEFNKYDFRKFIRKLENNNIRKSPQKIILEIWDSFIDKKSNNFFFRIYDLILEKFEFLGFNTGKQYRCFSGRGHNGFNAFSILVIVIYFLIVVIGKFNGWWDISSIESISDAIINIHNSTVNMINSTIAP